MIGNNHFFLPGLKLENGESPRGSHCCYFSLLLKCTLHLFKFKCLLYNNKYNKGGSENLIFSAFRVIKKFDRSNNIYRNFCRLRNSKTAVIRRYLARLQEIWRNEIVETANETKMDGDRLTSRGADLEPRVLRILIRSVEHSRFRFEWFLIEKRALACASPLINGRWLIWWGADISANQNQRCKCALMSILS